MKRVLCVGSAVMDVLVQSNDLRVMKSHQVTGGVAMAEVYGGKTEAQSIALQTGGSGSNVAVGLARLGLVASSLVRVGDDWMKNLLVDDLKAEGVDVSLVQVDKKEKTGMSVVLVEMGGGRSIITYRGASSGIVSAEIDWDKVVKADWIQIGALGGNMALAEDLVNLAYEKKINVGWNPGKGELGQKERLMRLLPKIKLLVLNRMEAAQLTGLSYEEIKEMAIKISGYGVKTVIITDGKNGVGVMTEGVWTLAPAFRVKTMDETGAGDALVAGVVAGFLAEKDLVTILKMGLANGASEVTELGAKSGLLHKKEMAKWLRRRLKVVEERV